MIAKCRVAGAAFLTAATAAAAQTPPGPLDATSFVPADAAVVIGTSHLRQLNDSAIQLLAGMDRAGGIFGSRPLDRIRTVLGFNVGIDELGSACLAIIPSSDDPPQPRILLILPVTDVAAFLNANFQPRNWPGEKLGPDDAILIRHPRGIDLAALDLQEFVALSPDTATLKRVLRPGNDAGGIRNELEMSLREPLREADLFLVVRDWGALASLGTGNSPAEGQGARMYRVARAAAERVSQDWRRSVITLELDPLGIFIRLVGSLADSLDPDAAHVAESHDYLLASLPREPYLFAAGADRRGLALLRHLFLPGSVQGSDGAERLTSQRIAFAAYASDARHFFERALTIHRSGRGDVSIGRLLAAIESTPGVASVRTTAQDGAYRIEVARDPDVGPMLDLVWAQLFGPAGWHGVVAQRDATISMTFNPSAAAQELARRALTGEAPSLGTDPVIRSMRRWFPAGANLEMYFSVGRMRAMLQPQMQALRALGAPALPELAPGLPPIAIGIHVDGADAQATVIVPAGVAAALYDLALDAVRERLLAPKEPAAP